MTNGFIAVPLEHFGGMVTSWPPEMLDVSVSPFARNVRFTQGAVASREGLSRVWEAGSQVRAVVSLGELATVGPMLACDAASYYETAPGSGVLQQVAGASASGGGPVRFANAYQRAYIAYADSSGLVGTNGGCRHWDGVNLDPVTIAPPATAPAPGDSATAGNIAAGKRYCAVLFQQRDGSMTMGQFTGSWTAAGGKMAYIANIPTGPAQVVARVLAFTVAGGSSAGPYFFIPYAQTVNGLYEDSTVLSDNTSTTMTVNFDDAFLAASTDVTEYFRQIQLPAEAGVFYSASLDRMLWWGESGQPDLLRISEPGDAGLYLGDTGYVLVSPGDGQRVTAAFEYRGQLYCAKERSLYRITPNNGDPATWGILPISDKVGCCGPSAIAVGGEFVLLVGRGGAHLFTGGEPTNVSTELLGPAPDRPGLWQTINWSAAGLIWAHADTEALTLRVGVPTGQSAAPNVVLKVSYLDGWEPSIRFSVFTARYHYFPGRRWSVDEIGANGAWTVERPDPALPWAYDSRQAVRQIVLAAAVSPTGVVVMLDANATTDDGSAFWSEYQTGAVSAAQKMEYQRSGVELVGLVQLRARGGAALEVWAQSGMAKRLAMTAELANEFNGDHRGVALLAGEAVSLLLRSQGRWEAAAMYVYAKPWMAQRPGSLSSLAKGSS